MKLLFIIVIFFLGCKADSKKKFSKHSDSSIIRYVSVQGRPLSAHSDSLENFDTFFNRFEIDSVFQLSRTEFPLKTISYSDEEEETGTIDRKDGKYTNFTTIKGLIVSKTLISGSRASVLFSIEDTGINVTYYFDKKKGLWQLTSVVDESD